MGDNKSKARYQYICADKKSSINLFWKYIMEYV